MDGEETVDPVEEAVSPTLADAPSARARALREEIFGQALSLDEAAYILGLDRTTVAKYLRERMLRGFQIGREWLIPEAELRAYVKRMAEQQLRQEAGPGQQGDTPKGRKLKSLMERFGGESQSRPVSTAFSRFTTRARTVMSLAASEAHRLQHNYIGTEHVLLGLLAERSGVAAHVLRKLEVDLDEARRKVEAVVGRGKDETEGELGLTPRTKKVIELAVDEAKHLQHGYIGTEHLLLGLVREGEGIASGVLEAFGLRLQQVREETLRVLGAREAGEAAERSVPPVPAEAGSLLPDDAENQTCSLCGARSPLYFRYCFNCGERLEER